MLGKATLLNRRFFLLLTIYHRAGGLSRLFLKKLIFFTKGGEGSVPIRRKAKKLIGSYTVITADFGGDWRARTADLLRVKQAL